MIDLLEISIVRQKRSLQSMESWSSDSEKNYNFLYHIYAGYNFCSWNAENYHKLN